MRVRDAVEADARALAAIADAPVDVMRNLVHDRTVRVAAVDESTASATDGVPDHADDRNDADADEPPDESPDLLGFVSYDAEDGVVHVTQLDGTVEACERLLDEPVRFAEAEGMSVELLTPETEETVREAAEAAGFSRSGRGPRFRGTETVRYRLSP